MNKEDIRKEVLPMYAKPAAVFVASNACTIGAVASGVSLAGELVTGLAVADARNRRTAEKFDPVENVDISMLPKCEPEEVLFYDEYLDTGKMDGYYTMTEADWWKSYAKFQEKFNSLDFSGDPTFADFYSCFPKQKMFKERLKALGSWADCASWDISENWTTAILDIDVYPIDDTLECNYIHWIIAPRVDEEDIRNGLV